MSDTPRTDAEDINILEQEGFVEADFARELEREINALQKWKEEALKVMNQWNEVSDYINHNAEVEDLGRFVPQICLKYLKERDELKKKLEVS
jgi:hypothetical protein